MSPELAINDQLPLFSEREVILDAAQTQDASTAAAEAEVSLAGTSAPLLTNPSLTDVPVSVPPLSDGISNFQDTETNNTELSGSDEPAARYNVPSTRNWGGPLAALSRGSTRRTPSQYQDLRSRAQRQGRRGRPRGRHPRRPRGHTTTPSRQIAREIDTQPSITSDSDSEAPTAQPTSDVDQSASQVNPHSISLWNLWIPRLHLRFGSEQVSYYSNWTSENSGPSKASTPYPQGQTSC